MWPYIAIYFKREVVFSLNGHAHNFSTFPANECIEYGSIYLKENTDDSENSTDKQEN